MRSTSSALVNIDPLMQFYETLGWTGGRKRNRAEIRLRHRDVIALMRRAAE